MYSTPSYSTPWDTQFFNGTQNSRAAIAPRFRSTPITHVYNHPCCNPAIQSTSMSGFPSTQPSGVNYFPINQSHLEVDQVLTHTLNVGIVVKTVLFFFQILSRDMTIRDTKHRKYYLQIILLVTLYIHTEDLLIDSK